jgi:secreted trypsin-like serine protease
MKLVKIFPGLLLTATLVACGNHTQQVDSLNVGQGIIGGGEVDSASRVSRSVVALYADGFGLCTGTLISNNAILTAAHCIPKDPTVHLNVIFSTNLKAANPANSRPIVKMYTNPRWGYSRDGKNTGDLAVVKFSGGLPSGYSPVGPLPYPSIVANLTMIFISGYGVSNGVSQSGSGVLRDTASIITNAQFSQTEVEVDQTNGRGSCNGDSGGPAFIIYNRVVYIWGVVSRGDRDCLQTGIYTNALVYWPWVNEILHAL